MVVFVEKQKEGEREKCCFFGIFCFYAVSPKENKKSPAFRAGKVFCGSWRLRVCFE